MRSPSNFSATGYLLQWLSFILFLSFDWIPCIIYRRQDCVCVWEQKKAFALWAVFTHFILTLSKMVLWQACTCLAILGICWLLLSCLIFTSACTAKYNTWLWRTLPHKPMVTYKLLPAIHIHSLWAAPAVGCYVTSRRAARHALYLLWCPVDKDILSSGARGRFIIHKLKRVSIRHLWLASQQFACLNEMPLWGGWWKSSL